MSLADRRTEGTALDSLKRDGLAFCGKSRRVEESVFNGELRRGEVSLPLPPLVWRPILTEDPRSGRKSERNPDPFGLPTTVSSLIKDTEDGSAWLAINRVAVSRRSARTVSPLAREEADNVPVGLSGIKS